MNQAFSDITYEHVSDNVHVFRTVRASRKAVDEYLGKLEELMQNHPPDEPFCFIVDLRATGLPSLAYTMRESRALLRRVTLPEDIRVVYLHNNDMMLHTMNVFLTTMRIKSERLILNGVRYDEALRWLCTEERAAAAR